MKPLRRFEEISPARDGIGALYQEAERQGWLADGLRLTPDLIRMCQPGCELCRIVLNESDPSIQPAVLDRCVQYLFAKGVEAAILWNSGRREVRFERGHLEYFQTDLPELLEARVVSCLKIGSQLYSAFRRWDERQVPKGRCYDSTVETDKLLSCVAHFGIAFAFAQGLSSFKRS